MDYYGFPPELYQLKFKSKGDKSLAEQIVRLYKEVRTYIPLYTTLNSDKLSCNRLANFLVLPPNWNRAAQMAVDSKVQVLTMVSLSHSV